MCRLSLINIWWKYRDFSLSLIPNKKSQIYNRKKQRRTRLARDIFDRTTWCVICLIQVEDAKEEYNSVNWITSHCVAFFSFTTPKLPLVNKIFKSCRPCCVHYPIFLFSFFFFLDYKYNICVCYNDIQWNCLHYLRDFERGHEICLSNLHPT